MSAMDPDPDLLYARGDITREEWMRRRPPAAAVIPMPMTRVPPFRPPASNRRTLLAVSVVLVVAIVAAAAFFVSLGTRGVPAANPTYLLPKQLRSADLATLNASATAGLAFTTNDTLWFRPGPVALVVYMSPPDHDLTFVIQGLVNPAVHVSAGSRVTVTALNMDGDMYHNWALTTQGPPYGSMPMMGGGMMGDGTMMAMTMLGPASSSGFWSQQASFSATAGSYWYLCTYVGHASDGMYGSFVAG